MPVGPFGANKIALRDIVRYLEKKWSVKLRVITGVATIAFHFSFDHILSILKALFNKTTQFELSKMIFSIKIDQKLCQNESAHSVRTYFEKNLDIWLIGLTWIAEHCLGRGFAIQSIVNCVFTRNEIQTKNDLCFFFW